MVTISAKTRKEAIKAIRMWELAPPIARTKYKIRKLKKIGEGKFEAILD